MATITEKLYLVIFIFFYLFFYQGFPGPGLGRGDSLGAEETLEGKGIALQHEYSGGYITICIYQNVELYFPNNCLLYSTYYTLIKLILKSNFTHYSKNFVF